MIKKYFTCKILAWDNFDIPNGTRVEVIDSNENIIGSATIFIREDGVYAEGAFGEFLEEDNNENKSVVYKLNFPDFTIP